MGNDDFYEPTKNQKPLKSASEKRLLSMELRVLRYFMMIVQEKNISKAADRLHVSQPTVSRQLKDLEAELGHPI